MDDYDSPWKEVIELYFQQFIEFFFQRAFEDIDWNKKYEFLDKELKKISRKAKTGNRRVDKLVKVWLKNSEEEVFALIHVDVQSQYQKNFEERMYIYNYRLYDLFKGNIASFAILGDDNKKWHPKYFKHGIWGCNTVFLFPVIKLLDFRDKITYLEESNNPFAIVVMAHLQTMESAKDNEKRLKYKIRLIKLLYKKGYTKQDVINLFRFIDWIMNLPEDYDNKFLEELSSYEGEEQMQYITSVERIGYKKGVEQGIQLGKQEGIQLGKQEGIQLGKQDGIQLGTIMTYRKAIIDILKLRFNSIPLSVSEKINSLNDTQTIENLFKEAVRVQSIEELLVI